MLPHVCNKEEPWTQIMTRKSLDGLDKDLFVNDILRKLAKAEEIVGETIPKTIVKMRSQGRAAGFVLEKVQEVYTTRYTTRRNRRVSTQNYKIKVC